METKLRRRHGFNGEHSIVLPKMVVDMAHKDILASGLYITDIGYYPHASGHYRERRDPIDQYVLIYCAEGCGWYSVGGGERQEVKANEYFILPACEPHIYAADDAEPWTIYWVHFGGTQAPVFAEGAESPQKVTMRTNSRIGERNNVFEDIFNTLMTGYDLESVRYASSEFHYYLASLRYINKYRKEKAEISIVEAAVHYMKENIKRRVSLAEIATYVGYSPSHFATIFKAKKKKGPMGYMNDLRIEAARRYLEETTLNINQICFHVGIEDCYYFSRLFKKSVGVSPTEYRERGIVNS